MANKNKHQKEQPLQKNTVREQANKKQDPYATVNKEKQ